MLDWAQASSGLLPAGSLLLSSRAPIGYMAFTTTPTAINQGFAGIVRKEASTAYAWAWCHAHMDTIKGNAGGSTFPEISKSVFRKLPMLAPPCPVINAFGRVADNLIARVVAAVQQQEVLANLRDTLLPKLISGELRISSIEQRVASRLTMPHALQQLRALIQAHPNRATGPATARRILGGCGRLRARTVSASRTDAVRGKYMSVSLRYSGSRLQT